MQVEFEDLLALQHISWPSISKKKIRFSQMLESGEINVKTIGNGLNFDHSREYVAGDDIRHINWRLTAKNNKPFVKTFTKDLQQTSYICLDLNYYMNFGTENTFKSHQAINCASIIGWQHVLKKEKIGFFTNISDLELSKPNNNIKNFILFLHSIVNKVNDKNQTIDFSFIDVLTRFKQYNLASGTLYLISDFINILSDDLLNNIRLLSLKYKIELISIYDKFDYDLVGINNINLVDPKGNSVFLNPSAKNIKQYKDDWNNRKIVLEQFCLSGNIGLHLVSTSKVWYGTT